MRVSLKSSAELAEGEYELLVRVKGSGSSTASNESMSIELTPAPAATGVMLLPRGPTTGNREVPTADSRFRRTERLGVDVPTPCAEAVAARMLDRSGKPLPVSAAASVRDDPDGSRWRTLQLALPLWLPVSTSSR